MGKYKAPENDGGSGVRSSQGLFERRGNPWMTRQEADKEFERAFLIRRENKTLTRDQDDAADRAAIYETARLELEAAGYKLPKVQPPSREEISLHRVSGDPDIDMYAKATMAQPLPEGPTPKPMETTVPHRRCAADLRKLAAANLAIRKRIIRVK